jgi:hypothetical protein
VSQETSEIVNPFVKAMKDMRLDTQYVTQLRKEVIKLVDPFQEIAT